MTASRGSTLPAHAPPALRLHRRPSRRRHRLDDGVPLLLRSQPFRLAQAGLLYRPVLDLAAHGHRQPVPVLRRPGPGRGRGTRTELGALLEALGPGGGLRPAGNRRFLLDVSEELHLLRRPAWDRRDADHRAIDGGLGPRALAGGRDRHRGQAAGGRRAQLLARAGVSQRARLELAGPDQPQAHHRGLRSAHPVAGCHVVGHGGRAVAAGAPAGDGAASHPARRCAIGVAGALEPYLVHAAPACVDRGDDCHCGLDPQSVALKKKRPRGPLWIPDRVRDE